MAIEKEPIGQRLAGRNPHDAVARNSLLEDLKEALSERIVNAELDLLPK